MILLCYAKYYIIIHNDKVYNNNIDRYIVNIIISYCIN